MAPQLNMTASTTSSSEDENDHHQVNQHHSQSQQQDQKFLPACEQTADNIAVDKCHNTNNDTVVSPTEESDTNDSEQQSSNSTSMTKTSQHDKSNVQDSADAADEPNDTPTTNVNDDDDDNVVTNDHTDNKSAVVAANDQTHNDHENNKSDNNDNENATTTQNDNATDSSGTVDNDDNDDDANNADGSGGGSGGGPPRLVDYARRGAVGAVGGAMTAIGLVMIPLPTPFGAVIASSGLAVLGTEFKGAKELNDRLIEGAKHHVNSAREYMVNSIESMEDNNNNTTTSSSSSSKQASEEGDGGDGQQQQNDGCDDDDDYNHNMYRPVKTYSRSESGNDATVTSTTIGDYDEDDDIDVAETTSCIDNDEQSKADPSNVEASAQMTGEIASTREQLQKEDKEEEEPPKWLHMNQVERERQERLAQQRYKRETKSNYEHTKEYLTRKTGLSSFLSKTVLPILKGSEKGSKDDDASQQQQQNITTVDDSTKIKNDGGTSSVSSDPSWLTTDETVVDNADGGYVIVDKRNEATTPDHSDVDPTASGDTKLIS